ncbi:hypothetical protein [Actinomadura opuntiae]|uniref:hypothetical protein n=1 Tax=Actinomadura sp. OS1-43 TaxID=604315 RepID=UPI00255ACE0D|nr:hypothetical protein [Actinomadura sp. OS1-43]MDL4812769.1 hypothetical protein [Actinomadura sp. OS1-43]
MEITTIRDNTAEYWCADDDRWIRRVVWHRRTREVTVRWEHRSDLLSRSGAPYRGHKLLGRAEDRPTADGLARDALAHASELAVTRPSALGAGVA